ncbi:MAG: DUF937 domain-containing protein [Methanomicrobiales archaeon]|nr:DUF937 domain-containing protein [Methanomicrobiales archaeon]
MLTKMLSQSGSSNPMDNISGFLGNPAVAGGGDTVSTFLGNQMGPIQNAISQKTGLPPAVVGKVLAIVTPMVMDSFSKMFGQQKMDAKGLSTLLGDQSKMAMQASPDAANIGKQLLPAQEESGGILGKR